MFKFVTKSIILKVSILLCVKWNEHHARALKIFFYNMQQDSDMHIVDQILKDNLNFTFYKIKYLQNRHEVLSLL